MGQDARQIAHRPGSDEKAGFFAEHAGCGFLKAVYGWIFPINIVADLSFRHCLAHLCGGKCHGVGS
jgi:hypothetical protein